MKKIIYLIIIFNFLLKPYADASIKDNIITNFKNTQNLSFEFKQNINEIVALGEFGSLEIKISNLPSESNPRTGKISAFSALATLKKITSNIRVGT